MWITHNFAFICILLCFSTLIFVYFPSTRSPFQRNPRRFAYLVVPGKPPETTISAATSPVLTHRSLISSCSAKTSPEAARKLPPLQAPISGTNFAQKQKTRRTVGSAINTKARGATNTSKYPSAGEVRPTQPVDDCFALKSADDCLAPKPVLSTIALAPIHHNKEKQSDGSQNVEVLLNVSDLSNVKRPVIKSPEVYYKKDKSRKYMLWFNWMDYGKNQT